MTGDIDVTDDDTEDETMDDIEADRLRARAEGLTEELGEIVEAAGPEVAAEIGRDMLHTLHGMWAIWENVAENTFTAAMAAELERNGWSCKAPLR